MGSQTTSGTTDIREFGQELWTYLTGRGAVIEYSFDDLAVQVPQTTGENSPSATWKLHGTVRIRTSDNNSAGAVSHVNGT